MSELVAERWLPVVGWEGLYVVSDVGKVCSPPRRVHANGGHYLTKHRVKALSTCPRGYKRVQLERNGRRQNALVHRAVLRAFVGPPPSTTHVARHLNGNPADNRVENLAWGTQVDNCADRDRHGRTHRGGTPIKLDWPAVVDILCTRHTESGRVAGARHGVTQSMVSMIRSGKSWRLG